MKRGKVVPSDGLCMPDGTMMRNIEEEGYKYPGILEVDAIKHDEMKKQLKKEYIRRDRNILKSNLNGGNIISATVQERFQLSDMERVSLSGQRMNWKNWTEK